MFDLNILAIATGIEEHNFYALDFIEARAILKVTCPGRRRSCGGVSNLSFAFRGNDRPRGDALGVPVSRHQAGLDMAIVNAGQLTVYETIPKDLLEHVEDVILNRRPDATDRLVRFAATVAGRAAGPRRRSGLARGSGRQAARACPRAGIVDFIEKDVEEARGALAATRCHRRAADGGMSSSAICSARARCSCRRSSRARA